MNADRPSTASCTIFVRTKGHCVLRDKNFLKKNSVYARLLQLNLVHCFFNHEPDLSATYYTLQTLNAINCNIIFSASKSKKITIGNLERLQRYQLLVIG